MQTDILTLSPELNLREALAVLASRRISGAPVVDEDGKVLGVVSIRDVAEFLLHAFGTPVEEIAWAAPGAGAVLDIPLDLEEHPVERVMTPTALSVSADDSVMDAAAFMDRSRIHRALVFEEERLVGLVTPIDLLRCLFGIRGACSPGETAV